MNIYSDEHIEYWGAVYLDNPVLRKRGVLFSTFVEHPQDILRAVIYGDPVPEEIEHLPLLPNQLRVSDQLEFEDIIEEMADLFEDELESEGIRISNGAAVEKLRHHANPKPHRKRRHHYRPNHSGASA